MTADARLGAVLFDPLRRGQASALQGGGLAVLDGAVQRVSTIADLARIGAPAVWVTALSRKAFADHDAARQLGLTDASFLPTPLHHLCEELGVDMVQPERAAAALAPVLVRVERVARTWGAAVTRDARSLSDALLSGSAPAGAPTALELDPFVRASNTWAQTREGRANDLSIRLPLHRLVQARRVLGLAVPEGAWREVNLGAIADPVAWLQAASVPVLVQTSIVRGSTALSRLMVRRPRHGGRIWLASPEFQRLSQVAHLTVERVLAAEAYAPLRSSSSLQGVLHERAVGTSISFGLCAEALLCGLCTQSASVPVRTWLTSQARAFAFGEALALAAAQFTVTAYDVCHVHVSVPRPRLPELLTYLADSDTVLLAPTSLAQQARATPARRTRSRLVRNTTPAEAAC